MNDSERLAIAQALYNHLGKLVSTKDPDSLRVQADREYKALFEQTGAKSFEVRVNGAKVGTYSIKVSKAKPEEIVKGIEVKDPEALYDNIGFMQIYYLIEFARDHSQEFAEWYGVLTGEALEGCEWVEYVTPATEPAYMGGTLKVDPEDVANAIQGLNIGINGLLEG